MMIGPLLCFLFILLYANLFSPASSQLWKATSSLQLGSPWPIAGRNQYSFSQSPFVGPSTGEIYWKITPDLISAQYDHNSQYSAAVIGASGDVYFSSKEALYAINPGRYVDWSVSLSTGTHIVHIHFLLQGKHFPSCFV